MFENDVKKTFSVAYPKNWKTNLYFDETQSSIFTADTTKQLTETVLLDITFINKEINFNDSFKLQQEQESLYRIQCAASQAGSIRPCRPLICVMTNCVIVRM